MGAGYLHINKEEVRIASGHIEVKKGWLYFVLNLPDADGKCQPNWIAAHMKEKGNKTLAKNMLPWVREEWTKKNYLKLHQLREAVSPEGEVILYNESDSYLFYDVIMQWLDYKYRLATQKTLGKKSIELNTYVGYEDNVKNPEGPYFKEKGFTIEELTKEDIERFYEKQLIDEDKKVTTVKHYHARRQFLKRKAAST